MNSVHPDQNDSDDAHVAFGLRLREERLRIGLVQEQMCIFGGVSKRSQVVYEAGAGAPNSRYLSLIAEAGADVLYIVTGQRNPELRIPFSIPFKSERFRIGLKQEDFALLCGVLRDAQVKYEAGKRSPNVEYLSGLAARGVDMLYLITGLKCQLQKENAL